MLISISGYGRMLIYFIYLYILFFDTKLHYVGDAIASNISSMYNYDLLSFAKKGYSLAYGHRWCTRCPFDSVFI